MLQLGHLELQFLLEDLKLKLSHCLAKKGIWPGMKVILFIMRQSLSFVYLVVYLMCCA